MQYVNKVHLADVTNKNGIQYLHIPQYLYTMVAIDALVFWLFVGALAFFRR